MGFAKLRQCELRIDIPMISEKQPFADGHSPLRSANWVVGIAKTAFSANRASQQDSWSTPVERAKKRTHCNHPVPVVLIGMMLIIIKLAKPEHPNCHSLSVAHEYGRFAHKLYNSLASRAA
ncbi:MAG: hypothetical protein ACRDBL_00900 [Rhabdaerophilum sp.]